SNRSSVEERAVMVAPEWCRVSESCAHRHETEPKTRAGRTIFLPMHTSLLQRFFPFLAVLGSVTALGIGTSWAKHWLFPVVGAQGTTAVRVGFSAVLVLLLWRPWRWHLSRADARAIVLYGA